MKEKFKKYKKSAFFGFLTGVVNGMFGAGGGMVAVPLLKKLGFDQKKAQENAVAVILPITVLSAIIYLFKGYVKFNDCLLFLPTGVIGAYIGTVIMKKISPLYLKCIFALFMIYAGVKTVIK